MEWNYLVMIISGILALLLVSIELRRTVRRNLIWRLLASVLAVAALTFIALPPSYIKKKNTNGEQEVVLLTGGYDKDSLSAFTNAAVIATDKKLLDRSGNRDGIHIPSIDYYLSGNPGVKSLHVMGTGLPEDELAMLKDTRVQFHESAPAFGFQKVNWQPSIKSGDDLIIYGTFNNNSDKPVRIQLKGLSTALDSAAVGADSLISFKLNCTPRQLGKAVNYLVVTSGKDTIGIEKVPFEVNPVKPLSILVLSSAPNFEVNFLKQWLSESKFQVAVRSKISKDKFSTEFVNMDPVALSFQSGSLEKFDALVADETSLNQLSQAERSSLNKQVNNGLGLLILDEEEVKLSGSFGASFPVVPIAGRENISFNIPGIKNQTVLPGGSVNHLAPRAYDQPLVLDHKNRILVNSISAGQGRIIFSTINTTYFLKLSGNTTHYSSFWSYLIEKTARQERSGNLIKMADRFPSVHEKARIVLQTRSREIPQLSVEESGISLEQDAGLPHRWTGAFWPFNPGWNTLKTADGVNSSFFVFDTDDWLSVRTNVHSQVTRRFAEQSNSVSENKQGDPVDSRETVPPIFFYLVLLACCSYLWIETKFL